jgi:hypothetical protein
MRDSKTINILSLCLIAAAVVILAAGAFHLPPRFDKNLHAEIGRTLAREAAKLGASGKEIVLIRRDNEAFSQPAMETAAAAFRTEITRSGIKEVTIHAVRLDPLKPAEVPSGDFFEILRRSTDKQMIVSLLGPPILSEDQVSKLGTLKAKVVAFCPGATSGVDLRTLFKAGLLHAAIIERNSERQPGNKPGKVTFDQLYTVVESGSSPSLTALR